MCCCRRLLTTLAGRRLTQPGTPAGAGTLWKGVWGWGLRKLHCGDTLGMSVPTVRLTHCSVKPLADNWVIILWGYHSTPQCKQTGSLSHINHLNVLLGRVSIDNLASGVGAPLRWWGLEELVYWLLTLSDVSFLRIIAALGEAVLLLQCLFLGYVIAKCWNYKQV